MTTKLKNRPRLPVDIAVEPDTTAPHINPELARPVKGIYDSSGKALQLGARIGGGGEGNVFDVQRHADLVAKLYLQPPSPEKAEKLIALAKLGNERLFKMAAWPVDVLRDRPNGNVIGFVMKKIGHAAEVHTLHSPKSRLQKFPEASWAFLLHVATNIARAVATMHEHGFVIGDVNPKNILVTRQATVYLLDCDSFQFIAEDKTYRCEGGFPEYTPPELQGIPFADVDRTQEHDCFGLAVVIFQLLFLGRHPFSGRFLGAGEMPLEQAIREGRFAYGEGAAARQMQPPPGTLPLAAIPANLQALLQRAFLATDRPNPAEWIAPLEQLSKNLKACIAHNGHHYAAGLAACPWCHLETRVGVRLFNLKFGQRQQSGISLAELWDEIERLEAFQQLPQQTGTVVTEPSEAVRQYSLVRDLRYRVALGFAGVMGALIAWFSDLPVAFWFLIFAGGFARLLVKVHEGDSLKLESILPQRLRIPTAAALPKIQSMRKAAEGQLRHLEQQLWGKKNGEQEYIDQLNRIKSWQHEYETLEQQHALKIKRKTFKAALAHYLQQFTIKDSGLVSPSMASWMHSKGIRTAADITNQGLRQQGVVNEYHLQRLNEWRQKLEAQFNFDGSTHLPPETMVEIRRELDGQRQRLETELVSNVQRLRDVRQQIEARRHQLLPTWTKTRQELSQAECDWNEVVKENRLAPVIVTMLVAFLFISLLDVSLHTNLEDLRNQPYVAGTAVMPKAAEAMSEIQSPKCREYFETGEQFFRQADYRQARNFYDQAIANMSFSAWEPGFAKVIYKHCLATEMLGETGQQTYYFEQSLSQLNDKDRAKLIMLYWMKSKDALARGQYDTLKKHQPAVSDNVRQYLKSFGFDLEKST